MRLYVVQKSYMLFKKYTTYEIFYTTYDKKLHNIWEMLDNMYKNLEQHMTYFTQHIKIFHTTYDNNSYNISKKLYNILKKNQPHMTHCAQHTFTN